MFETYIFILYTYFVGLVSKFSSQGSKRIKNATGLGTFNPGKSNY